MSNRNVAGLVVAALMVGCGGQADEPATAAAVGSDQVVEPAAESQPVDATGPIVVDEAFVEAGADGVAFELEQTSNLYVAAYQRAYVTAVENAREARKFDAAAVANEIAAQAEEQRKAGGAAAAPASGGSDADAPPAPGVNRGSQGVYKATPAGAPSESTPPQ